MRRVILCMDALAQRAFAAMAAACWDPSPQIGSASGRPRISVHVSQVGMCGVCTDALAQLLYTPCHGSGVLGMRTPKPRRYGLAGLMQELICALEHGAKRPVPASYVPARSQHVQGLSNITALCLQNSHTQRPANYAQGYGARWEVGEDHGVKFRGFLEPSFAGGHEAGWRHGGCVLDS